MTVPNNFEQVALVAVPDTDEGGGGEADKGGADKVVSLWPRHYFEEKGAIYFQEEAGEDGKEKPKIFVCSKFEAPAETRGLDGQNWGLSIKWNDRDGRSHSVAIPKAMLAGDGVDARRLLMDGGMSIAYTKRGREKFHDLLLSIKRKERVTAVSRVGWHTAGFVLPDETIGATNGEGLLLQTENPLTDGFEVRGDVEKWQAAVGKYLPGNSRLIFAASAALAAPLLHLVGEESGGVNFVGPSSIGKSTAAIVAASLCGGPAYVRQWRTTANGLEGVAAGHCDLLLVLDELGQINSHEAAQVAYMLANGSGKSRAAKSGAARAAQRWRTLFLSTGEITLGDKIAEDGRKRIMAGQAVRCLDIPADAAAGLGLFENLHGAADGDHFARQLKAGTLAAHGAPIRQFIAHLIANKADLAQLVKERKEEFAAEYLPQGADGQVSRAAGRFGLIAAAGEMGATLGILPILPAEAVTAAAACFRAWIAQRGGSGAAETEAALGQVARFLEQHGEARFAWISDPTGPNDSRIIQNRAGFRERVPVTKKRKQDDGTEKDTTEDVIQFYILPETWRKEVCAGLNLQTANKLLIARDYLKPDPTDGKAATRRRLPGLGVCRCYQVSADLLARDAVP